MKPPTLAEYHAWEATAKRPYTQDPIGAHHTKPSETAIRDLTIHTTPTTSKERNRAWRARKKAA